MTEKELEKIKLKHLKNNLQIYKDNKDLVVLYNDYINKIVEFFDFIKVTKNDFLYTIVFDILTEIGFFTCHNNLDTNRDNFEELSIMPGISVINGACVCRNIACFYEDVSKHFFDYPLTLCCFDKYENADKDTAIYGNHMINLTTYHDTIYGFDIMNHCLFKSIGNNRLKGVEVDYYLVYKEYGDLLIHLTTQLEKNDDFLSQTELKKMLLRIASRKDVIESSQYKRIISDANDFIISRKKIFRSFLDDNNHYHEEIKQKMLSLK